MNGLVWAVPLLAALAAQAAAPREETRAGMAGQGATATAPSARAPGLVSKPDIRYATMPGVDARFHSLDLYAPPDARRLPVLIMIHGGGWRGGDKGNRRVGEALALFYCTEGFVFVSVNYRLTPAGRHPANLEDVAKAVAWVHEHAAEHGGDPGRLFVMGHWAGGHLAALLAADARRLKAEGCPPGILKGAVLLDAAAYDVLRYLKELARSRQGAGMRALYESAFGSGEDSWHDGSPQTHVAAGQGIPPMLMSYTGARMAADKLAPAFAAALTQAGAPSRAIDTVDLEHGEILAAAARKDHPLAQLTPRFLRGEEATRFPERLVRRAPETAARAPTDSSKLSVAFSRDYVAGTKDRRGQYMGGTETMRLAAHNGMLFAGVGYWTDRPGPDPRPGAQILVKRGPNQPWEVERNFSEAVRINALEPIVFSADGRGTPLPEPVRLLIADAGAVDARGRGPLSGWVRDDRSGTWVEGRIASNAARAYVRAFGVHRDRVTGAGLVFAGTGAGEVYSGVFDPQASGRIRWNPVPEFANPDFDGGPFRRCQGFCVANGKAYASIAPALVERRDGAAPAWKEVFRWTPRAGRAGQGLRGITAVPDPKGGRHEVILGSREQEGRILRIDPANGYRVELELESDVFLREKFGDFRGGKLVAYNRFEPGSDPRTGAPIHWVTVAGTKPGDPRAAWLMIRHADATYEPVRVFDPDLQDHPMLVSTRTLEFAPWSEREFYTGGYDGAANHRSNHNTAWIFRGLLPDSGTSVEKKRP
jgi:acetyl esterase/lipase